MNPEDITKVLATCSLYDYRFGRPSFEVAALWHRALHDLDLDDAIQAVVRHYAKSTDRIMPAHIRQEVREIRNDRRRNQPSPARALPSRFEIDTDRQERVERGMSTIRDVLGPLLKQLEQLAAQRPQLPSAFDELRALTSTPAVLDDHTSEGGPR